MCSAALTLGQDATTPDEIVMCETRGVLRLLNAPKLALVSPELLQRPNPLRLEVREGEFVIHAPPWTVTYRHRPGGWPEHPGALLFERVAVT
jgi:hypothetical protein